MSSLQAPPAAAAIVAVRQSPPDQLPLPAAAPLNMAPRSNIAKLVQRLRSGSRVVQLQAVQHLAGRGHSMGLC